MSATKTAEWRVDRATTSETEPPTSVVRQRAAELGLTGSPGLRPVAHVIALVGCWAGLCVIGFVADSIWVWLPVWLLVGFVFMGFAGAAHECVHGTFSGSRRVNTVAGHLLLLVAAAPFTTYRQFHLFHHAHTLGEHDPEGPPADFTTRLQYVLYMVALGPGFLALIWFQTICAAFGHPPAWARTRASRRSLRRAWLPTLPALVVLAVACVESPVVREVWLYPWLFLLTPILGFVLLSEHYAGQREDGLLANTYTVTSNRLSSFVLFNINHHTAHHLVPRVPGHRLAELNRTIAPFEHRRARGYLAFHGSLLASLPWRSRSRSDRAAPD
jgi:fatty acid desaturase